jgi:AraC-like DNA-binding protein
MVSASVANITGSVPRRAAADVRRAIDYIEANLTSPLTLEDIVRAAGVSGRSLFRHFRSATGVSPLAYLRDARFRRVRATLSRAHVDARIVDVAALWGFDHMGRFAVEYRRRFGEKPSDTRASARADAVAQRAAVAGAGTAARRQISTSPASMQPVEMSCACVTSMPNSEYVEFTRMSSIRKRSMPASSR